jgi:hypothetical protein
MLRFSSVDSALQYLSDYTGDRVFIAGYEEQKPSIIEKLKKHKSNIKDEEIESILESIQKCDPVSSKTKGKKSPFTEQIVNWYVNNKIRLPEDENTVKDTLQQYSKFKGKIKKKVDKFNSPGDLRKELEQYIDSPDEQSYDDIAKVVASDNGYKMYQIDDFDKQGKVCFKDSGWCVQQESMFDSYKPPYFMVVKGNKRYALLHKDSYQLKDVHDSSLTVEQAKPIMGLIVKVFPEYKFEGDLENLISLFDLTEEEQLEAFKSNVYAIEYIDNPSEAVQLEAVKQDGSAIEFVDNPSEVMQLEAVKKDGDAINYIIEKGINPSEVVQLKAVKGYGRAIRYIENPSEAVQLEAVKDDGSAIEFIDNPSEKVKEMAKRKAASIKFATEEKALQYLSDFTGNRVKISGYEDQKPSVIEKFKKHKSNIKDKEIESKIAAKQSQLDSLINHIQSVNLEEEAVKMIPDIIQPIKDYYESDGEKKPDDQIFKSKSSDPDLAKYDIEISYFPSNGLARIHDAEQHYIQFRFPQVSYREYDKGDIPKYIKKLEKETEDLLEHEMGHFYLEQKGAEDVKYHDEGYKTYFKDPQEIVLHGKIVFNTLSRGIEDKWNELDLDIIERRTRSIIKRLPIQTGMNIFGAKITKALENTYWKHILKHYIKPKMNKLKTSSKSRIKIAKRLKVYHGTASKFNKFDLDKSTQGIIWFTSDKNEILNGEIGASGKGYIVEAEVTIDNPAGWDEYDKLGLFELEREYDGVVLPNSSNKEFTCFVFDPKQIKIINVEEV